ncbi:MAG: OmpH family outer membrane protein [Thermodesulfovibrionales bacterium]|jgi:Skp family chaperone for outer membrane proteins
MQKNLLGVCASCLIFMALPHPAQGQVRLALVDILKTLNESSIGQEAKSGLTEFIQSRQELIDKEEGKIEEFKAELARTPEASEILRERRTAELERLIEEYREATARLQQEIAEKQEELTLQVTERLKTVVEEIGLVEEYTLILDKDDDIVLYCDKALLLEIK